MGFGLLFVGYFFLIFFPLSRVDILPNIALIGCVFMLMGLRRLTRFCAGNRGFKLALTALIILSAAAFGALMIDIAGIDGMLNDNINSILVPVTNAVYALAITAFTTALFVGIYRLSIEVELPKLARRSVLMLSATAVHLIAELAAAVCSLLHTFGGITREGFTIVTGYIGIFAFLLAYITLFLNLSLIFTCYIRICLEGDEDMPYREDIFDKIVAWTKRNKK